MKFILELYSQKKKGRTEEKIWWQKLGNCKIWATDWIAAPSPIHDVPYPGTAECAYAIYHIQYLSTKLFLQNMYFIQFLSANFSIYYLQLFRIPIIKNLPHGLFLMYCHQICINWSSLQRKYHILLIPEHYMEVSLYLDLDSEAKINK